MKQIKLTITERRALQARFNVGDNYILDVLGYRKDGPTARRIRQAALEMGGRYVDPDFVPNCNTSYVGGYITQTFSEGVVLRIERSTGNLTISHRDQVVEKVDNARMSDWQAAALKAQRLAEVTMVAK